MSSRVHNRPIEPGRWGARIPKHYEDPHRAHTQHEMMQNVFRMWRDFPSLRFGQFIANAIGHDPRPDLFNIEDEAIHEKLYEFWLKHSKKGKEITKRLEARRNQRVEDAEVIGPGGCPCKICNSSDPDDHTRCAHCCPYRE